MFRIHHVLTVVSTIWIGCISHVMAGEAVATTQPDAPFLEASKVDGTVRYYLDTLASHNLADPVIGIERGTRLVRISLDPVDVQSSLTQVTELGRQTTQPATRQALIQDRVVLDMPSLIVSGGNVRITRQQDKSGNEMGPYRITGERLQLNDGRFITNQDGNVLIMNDRSALLAKRVEIGDAELTADPNGDLMVLNDLKRLNIIDTSRDQNSSYLGVGVEPPSDALRSQLNLAPGGGLLVTYVDEAGPSKSVLQKHDVLQKLDDQILINPEQLIALIHMHSPGDSVTLTFLRQASPRTEKITLGHKASTVQDKVDAKYTSQSIADLPVMGALFRRDGAGANAHSISFSDGEMTAVLDANQNLLVTDAKTGLIVFQGPAATPEQWEKVPALVRKKLAEWRDMVGPKKEVVTPPASKQ